MDTTPSGETAAVLETLPGTIAKIMEPAPTTMQQDQTVSAAVDFLVQHGRPQEVSYLYLLDPERRLVGVVGMRDLLLGRPAQSLQEVMVSEPFAFAPETSLRAATMAALRRKLPRYPVVDGEGVLGHVPAWKLFERVALEVGHQPGSMVGLDRAERIHAPLLEAFRMRHPWLQLNLLTAFMAAIVVGLFEDTIARIVALAAGAGGAERQHRLPGAGDHAARDDAGRDRRLPGGAAGGQGTRARGHERRAGRAGRRRGHGPVCREQDTGEPLMLGFVVFVAMVGACVASGLFGVLVPFTLRGFGADPAMASTIFLTTLTDILGMGLLLWLATALLL
jgi:magnesium transporter